MTTPHHRTRLVIWSATHPSARSLKRDGYHLLPYPRLREQAARARQTESARSSLRNPSDHLFRPFQRHAQIAATGVTCHDIVDLQTIHDCLVEPAIRHGCTLFLAVDRPLDSLQPTDFPDPDWRYPWTLERLRYLVDLGAVPRTIAVPRPVNRWRRLWQRLSTRGDTSPPIPTAPHLDAAQRAAVRAGDGVVQVIAPAGSGKTTVLIERVRELQNRGTAANRILCLSFNRDAKQEIAARLATAGLTGVETRSFHGLGLWILREEGRLRPSVGELDAAAWGNLIHAAGPTPDGSPMKPDMARELVTTFKLAAMITPDEAIGRAAGLDPAEQHAAAIYTAYEQELARRRQLDFDDLVAGAVRLLQTDAAVRHRWQRRFDRVLVDEYQDIEPVQALLVGILAAPQDSLFCVGDEDQCIYAWRRATVRRIIELDLVYPDLERYALCHNYRCGRRITTASRRLIEHNRIRFRKPLKAGAKSAGDIMVWPCGGRGQGAQQAAVRVHAETCLDTVVLARTSRLLDEVIAACDQHPEGRGQTGFATIHAAKGREWSRVILYGADEGLAPHRQALREGGLEDERRLFYVALTRAKERLEIICTRGKVSRFVREAGLRGG